MIDAAINGILPAAAGVCGIVSGVCGVQWAHFRSRGDRTGATCILAATSLVTAGIAAFAGWAGLYRFAALIHDEAEWMRDSGGYLVGWSLVVAGAAIYLRTICLAHGRPWIWRAIAAGAVAVWVAGFAGSLALR
jgi:hypothetical protein